MSINHVQNIKSTRCLMPFGSERKWIIFRLLIKSQNVKWINWLYRVSNYNCNQMTEHRQHNIHIQVEQMTIIERTNRPNLHSIQVTLHRFQSDLLVVCPSLRIVYPRGHNLLFTPLSLQSISLPVSHTHTVAHIIQFSRTI